MSTLTNYLVYLARQRQPFSCPTCTQSLLPKHYEKHCRENHGFNGKRNCVWCRGGVSWLPREKKRHVSHLMQCARQFLAFARKPPLPPAPDVPLEPDVPPSSPDVPLEPASVRVPFDLTPVALERCLFDHVFESPPEGYDAFCNPYSLNQVPLPLQTEALTLAVACVQTYLRLRETTEWFHVMVRSVGYTDFMRALDPDHMRTLPFSCWCDGGKPTVASHRQHRHFILVCDLPGHYATWSDTLVFQNRPRRYFRCFYSKPIESAMHLVNVLGYLSKRPSRCMFADKNKKTPVKNNHFYLFQQLPKDYRLPLVLQWPGGLDELLHQQYKNLKRSDLAKAPVHYDSRYRIRIRDIPGIPLGTVLPVARDFEPCDEETDAFVYLTGGRKLCFKRNPELLELDEEAWLQRQADKGNVFYDAVGNDLWTPRPYHQTILNDFKPYIDRNCKLETQIAELKERIAQLEDQITQQQREAEDSQRRLAHQQREAEDSQRRLEAKEQENERLGEQLKEAQAENKRLMAQINHMQQVEIERLRSEVAELKKDNERLRNEVAELKREIERLRSAP